MGTMNNPGKYDCIERLRREPDMPYFLLLGADRHAPALVWIWSTLRELDGDDQEKAAEARRACAEMMKWQAENGRRACGFAQAVMAGIMDMARAINSAAKEPPKNDATPLEMMRLYLAEVNFGDPEQLRKAAEDSERVRAVAAEYDEVLRNILPAKLAEDGDEADFVIRARDYRALRDAALRAA